MASGRVGGGKALRSCFPFSPVDSSAMITSMSSISIEGTSFESSPPPPSCPVIPAGASFFVTADRVEGLPSHVEKKDHEVGGCL